MRRTLHVPGSPSSALTTRYFGLGGFSGFAVVAVEWERGVARDVSTASTHAYISLTSCFTHNWYSFFPSEIVSRPFSFFFETKSMTLPPRTNTQSFLWLFLFSSGSFHLVTSLPLSVSFSSSCLHLLLFISTFTHCAVTLAHWLLSPTKAIRNKCNGLTRLPPRAAATLSILVPHKLSRAAPSRFTPLLIVSVPAVVGLVHEGPLEARGKAGATTAAQPRGLDLIENKRVASIDNVLCAVPRALQTTEGGGIKRGKKQPN